MAGPNSRPIRVLERYALYEPIAAGGMATVHLGRLIGPVGFARTVAIKRLHAQFAKDPEFVSMFLDEARLAARIRHPNVVQTLDVISLEDELFLVMEYVQGDSLAKLTQAARRERRPMPAPYAAAITAGTLHGLHAAHEARGERGEPLEIVHRDVSPQNILVCTDGMPRLLDFGVAKATGRLHTTRQGELKGKIAYMSPEQLRGEGVDRRTDVYAAGVVLWEALTGQRLFQGENDAVVFGKVLSSNAPAPSLVTPGISAALDAIVLRALSGDRKLRFETARDMARALEISVPLVAPTELGEWVERMAGDSLAKRAQTVVDIEADSSTDARPPVSRSPRDAVDDEDATTTPAVSNRPAASEGVTSTQLSTTALAGTGASRTIAPPLGRMVAIGGGITVVAIAVLLVRQAFVSPAAAEDDAAPRSASALSAVPSSPLPAPEVEVSFELPAAVASSSPSDAGAPAHARPAPAASVFQKPSPPRPAHPFDGVLDKRK